MDKYSGKHRVYYTSPFIANQFNINSNDEELDIDINDEEFNINIKDKKPDIGIKDKEYDIGIKDNESDIHINDEELDIVMQDEELNPNFKDKESDIKNKPEELIIGIQDELDINIKAEIIDIREEPASKPEQISFRKRINTNIFDAINSPANNADVEMQNIIVIDKVKTDEFVQPTQMDLKPHSRDTSGDEVRGRSPSTSNHQPDSEAQSSYLQQDPENGTQHNIIQWIDSGFTPKKPDVFPSTCTPNESNNFFTTENRNNFLTSSNRPKSNIDDYLLEMSELVRTANNEISSDSSDLYLGPVCPMSEDKDSRKTQCEEKASFHHKQKILRHSGQPYVDSTGRALKAVKFSFLHCTCPHLCRKALIEEDRRKIFTWFWNLSDWSAQRIFIMNSIKKVALKRHHYTSKELKRGNTFRYQLNNIDVCKSVYSSVLGISKYRIEYITRYKIGSTPNGVVLHDKRRKRPCNKLEEYVINDIINFLESFPKYRFHYSNEIKVSFHPTLTSRQLHKLYLEKNKNRKICYATFFKVFKKYNIGIYIPKKAACSKCNNFSALLKSNPSTSEQVEIKKKRKKHFYCVGKVAEKLKQCGNKSKKKETKLLCFTFVLMTQPLPYVNKSVSYYKRHLRFYNFGINTRHDRQGHMFVWLETEGKRGSCDIGSAILTFLNQINLDEYEEIHTFSDAFDGQHRNQHILSLFIYVCEVFNIKSWTHSYMESGHSYLPNDTDFGKIEKLGNKKIRICSKEEWIDIIQQCKFNVTDMKGKFLDLNKIQEKLHFELTNIEGGTFNCLNLRWFKVTKSSFGKIKYQLITDPEDKINTVDFSKKGESYVFKDLNLPKLYEDPIPITREKYNDLQDLTRYIPIVFSDFYSKLPYEEDNESDVESLD